MVVLKYFIENPTFFNVSSFILIKFVCLGKRKKKKNKVCKQTGKTQEGANMHAGGGTSDFQIDHIYYS